MKSDLPCKYIYVIFSIELQMAFNMVTNLPDLDYDEWILVSMPVVDILVWALL